ncbi:geranylgeranyl reductase, partial [Streptomyces hydrogenans]
MSSEHAENAGPEPIEPLVPGDSAPAAEPSGAAADAVPDADAGAEPGPGADADPAAEPGTERPEVWDVV